MAQPTKFVAAHLDGWETDQTQRTATFYFQPPGGERLVLTIPLEEMTGLRADIEAALALTPELFTRT